MCRADFCAAAAMKATVLVYGCLGGGKIDAVLRADERTQEVDYLAERNGNLHAFDFKWSDLAVKKARLPLTFSRSYKNTEFSVISPQNVEDFLL